MALIRIPPQKNWKAFAFSELRKYTSDCYCKIVAYTTIVVSSISDFCVQKMQSFHLWMKREKVEGDLGYLRLDFVALMLSEPPPQSLSWVCLVWKRRALYKSAVPDGITLGKSGYVGQSY